MSLVTTGADTGGASVGEKGGVGIQNGAHQRKLKDEIGTRRFYDYFDCVLPC